MLFWRERIIILVAIWGIGVPACFVVRRHQVTHAHYQQLRWEREAEQLRQQQMADGEWRVNRFVRLTHIIAFVIGVWICHKGYLGKACRYYRSDITPYRWISQKEYHNLRMVAIDEVIEGLNNDVMNVIFEI